MLSAVSLLCSIAFGATLVGNNVSAYPGQQCVQLSVELYSCTYDETAALSFELRLNDTPVAIKDVYIGESALAAGKSLSYSFVASNVVYVVVSGFNQTPIPDGSIAYVEVSVAPDAALGLYPVSIENILLSAPEGYAVEAELELGMLSIGCTIGSLPPPLLNEVYVNYAHVGFERGTTCHPASSISSGAEFVTPSGTLIIDAPVESTERGIFSTPMRITTDWGIARIGVSQTAKTISLVKVTDTILELSGSSVLLQLTKRITKEQITQPDSFLEEDGVAIIPHSLVRELVLPTRTDISGTRWASPDETLYLRLTAEEDIIPESIRASAVTNSPFSASYQSADGTNNTRDMWVVFQPEPTWRIGSQVVIQAEGISESGQPISTRPITFSIKQEPLLEFCEDLKTGLPQVGRAPFRIQPNEVYPTPKWVWLPLPAHLSLENVQVYYYHAGEKARGWYPGSHVIGWLVSGSQCHRIINGKLEIGFQVRHGGLLQFGPAFLMK